MCKNNMKHRRKCSFLIANLSLVFFRPKGEIADLSLAVLKPLLRSRSPVYFTSNCLEFNRVWSVLKTETETAFFRKPAKTETTVFCTLDKVTKPISVVTPLFEEIS